MALPHRVVGVLLAGGKSSRMGGGDKCLRVVGGRPILARIIDRLRPQVVDIVVNANEGGDRFTPFGLPVVADSIAGSAGPLAGVHASLEWVKANHPDIQHAVTVATDTPFFPRDLVARLLAASEDHAALRIAKSETGMHYVIGLWPVVMAKALLVSVERGERRVGAWVKDHGAIEVVFSQINVGGRALDPFFNINTPEDLVRAQALISDNPL